MAWRPEPVPGQPEILFDIPENVNDLQISRDFQLTVWIHGRDRDQWGGDNALDFSPLDGEQRVKHEFKLAGDVNKVPADIGTSRNTLAYLVEQPGEPVPWKGNLQSWTKENDEDAGLKVKVGDSLPKYFLELVTNQLVSAGRCYGEPTCITGR